jgi:large subunit ribosomal protein L7/L12
MSENIETIAKKMSKLNSTELSELSGVLLEKYNISATIYHFGIVPTIGINEPKICELHLINAGHSKLGTVKLIKEVFGLGLKDAKDIVDSVPYLLSDNISIEDAEKIKEALAEYGAKVEIN